MAELFKALILVSSTTFFGIFSKMTSTFDMKEKAIAIGHLINQKITNGYKAEDTVDNPNRNELKSAFSVKSPAEISKEKLFETMKYEVNRVHSFLGKWKLPYIKPSDLAQVGLFYLQIDDRVQCAFCRGVIDKWTVGDDPLTEHSKYYPLCPFLLGREVGNVPLSTPENTYLTIVFRNQQHSHPSTSQGTGHCNPKFPKLSDVKCRLLTYQAWPLMRTIHPKVLADAGFYYTEIGDVVTCFFCGGSLGSWNIGDDPVEEHKMYFPDCAFLKLLNRSLSLDHSVPNTANQNGALHRSISLESFRIDEASGSSSKEDILKSQIVEKASEIFSEPDVKEVVLQRYNDTKRGFASLQELCEAILEKDQKTNLCPVQEESTVQIENNTISVSRPKKDALLCKICMDRELGVVFMPCAHLVSCEICSKEILNCPLCRKPITSTIRTYMS